MEDTVVMFRMKKRSSWLYQTQEAPAVRRGTWSFNRHHRSCGDWRCDNRKPPKNLLTVVAMVSVNTNGKSACHFDCTLEISAVPR